MRLLRAVLPPTRLERDRALQCVISAFATGSFLTGTAVLFTQIVDLSGAQVYPAARAAEGHLVRVGAAVQQEEQPALG